MSVVSGYSFWKTPSVSLFDMLLARGFRNLMFPLWFALLGGSFVFLVMGPCIPPYLGALVYFTIGRVSSSSPSFDTLNSFGWFFRCRGGLSTVFQNFKSRVFAFSIFFKFNNFEAWFQFLSLVLWTYYTFPKVGIFLKYKVLQQVKIGNYEGVKLQKLKLQFMKVSAFTIN